MKVLILGGSGFVGTRLIELLKETHQVVIGDIARSQSFPELWQNCDVCDPESLRRVMAGQEVVVNLAAAHRDDVRPLSLYHQINVEGAENVCQVADEMGVKSIVFTSSVATYGFQNIACNEESPQLPFNEYGRTKLAAEAVYRQWQQQSAERRLAMIRPTVIFGEKNRGNVYNLFRQLSSGRFLMVGNGRNKKSMAYVGNVAAFLKWNIENGVSGCSIYNYVDKPDYDMHELIDVFERCIGGKIPSFSLPRWLGILGGYCFDVLAFLTRKNFAVSSVRVKKFCAQTVFDASKVAQTGFVPPFTLEEALLRTINFEFKTPAAK